MATTASPAGGKVECRIGYRLATNRALRGGRGWRAAAAGASGPRVPVNGPIYGIRVTTVSFAVMVERTPGAPVEVDGAHILEGLSAADVLAAMPDVIVVADVGGVVRYANRAVKELLGWEPVDLVGRPVEVLVPERLRQAHRSGLARFAGTGEARMMGHAVRVPAVRADGSEATVELSLSAHHRPDGQLMLLGSMRDMSELVSAHRQVELLLRSAGDGIYGLDTAGRVTFVNPAAVAMVGKSAEEQLNRSQHDLIHHHRADGSPHPADDCPIHAVLNDGVPRYVADDVFWRADGTSFPVAYRAMPIVDEDRVIGAVVSFRDLTSETEAARYREENLRLAAAAAGQQRVISQLVAAVTPPSVVVDGTEVGVSFLPASPDAPTGGDLYDWMVLPDGCVYLAVVDAQGHGVEATKDALAVVHVLRTLLLEGWALGAVLARADRILQRRTDDIMATALVARYQPDTGELRVASAGHPPPLVMGPSGPPRFLEVSGVALGWPGAGSIDEAETVLASGDTLVCYSDGLIEYDRDIEAGLADLLRRAASPDLGAAPVTGVCQALAAPLAGDVRHRDDALVVALRRTGSG